MTASATEVSAASAKLNGNISAGMAYGTPIRFITEPDALDDIPRTGGNSSLWIWWLLCGVSAAGTAALVVYGKRKAVRRR